MKILYSRNKLFESSLRIIFHTWWIDVKLLLDDNIVESSSSSLEKGKKKNKRIKRRFCIGETLLSMFSIT
jgi:hypothetical protein